MNHLAPAAGLAACSLVCAQDSETTERRELGRTFLHQQSGDAARAISGGIRWLVAHQDTDGGWSAAEFMHVEETEPRSDGAGSPEHDVGVTALTLLALLGDGNTPVSGPHRETVADGVAWLIGAQDPRSGVIGGAAGHDFIYDHAIATLALAEAWVLSCEDEALKAAAQQAVRYLGKHRNPHAAWRYAMRDGDNDTSVTGWCTLALHTAARGGLEVDERALPCALQWFDRVTEEESGRVGYARRGGRSSRLVGQHATRFPRDRGEVCTAIALYCRELTAPGDHPLRAAQAALVAACPPEWDEERGTIDEYYWFFGSHALFQVGGEAWDEWSRALVEQLPPRQREDGNFAGSWDPRGVWAGVGGRVYTTAMNVLALESFYRDARVTPVQDAPTGEQRVHPGLDGDR